MWREALLRRSAQRIQLLVVEGARKALAEKGNAALKRCYDWLQARNCSESRDILVTGGFNSYG